MVHKMKSLFKKDYLAICQFMQIVMIRWLKIANIQIFVLAPINKSEFIIFLNNLQYFYFFTIFILI